MKPSSLDLATDLVIVGLATRTSPARAAADIPRAWERFFAEGIARKVPGRRDDDRIYAVYCDYESDASGSYTMVLGVAVEAGALPAEGLRRVRLPAGRYASFRATGNPAEVIWKTWTHVNTAWPDRESRRYIADCERYRAEAFSQGSADAEILVGVA